MFSSHVTTRRGAQRFTAVQLNTLGRFDEPLTEVLDRQKILYNYLYRTRPSIAALEEVPHSATALEGNNNIVDELIDACPNYKSISYAKKTPRADMTCLVYDSLVFELVSEECFRFGEVDEGGATSQFAIIAVLKLRHAAYGASSSTVPTARSILVVAQHAKAGRNMVCENIRISHSKQLLEYLQNPSAPASNACHQDLYPTLLSEGKFIWLGDMNAGPHSYGEKQWPCEWYERVVRSSPASVGMPSATTTTTTKNDDESTGDWRNKSVALLSAMTVAHGGQEPPFTTFKSRDGSLISQTIDYILLSKGSKALVLTGVSSPSSVFVCDGTPNNSSDILERPLQALPDNGFPNADWGSDHLPLLCEIEYQEQLPSVPEYDRCGRN